MKKTSLFSKRTTMLHSLRSWIVRYWLLLLLLLLPLKSSSTCCCWSFCFPVIQKNKKNLPAVVLRNPSSSIPFVFVFDINKTSKHYATINPINDNNDVTDTWESSSMDDDDDDDDDEEENSEGEHTEVEEEEEELEEEEEISSDQRLQNEYDCWKKAVDNTIQSELKKAEQVEQLQKRANLLTTYLYLFADGKTKSVLVQDWEQEGAPEIQITLNPSYNTAAEEASAIYEQTRKFKRSVAVVRPLLESNLEALRTIRDLKSDLESSVVRRSDIDDGSIIMNEDLFRITQGRLLRSSLSTQFVPPSNETIINSNTSQKQQKTRHIPTSSSAATTTSTNAKKPPLGSPASNVRKLKSPAGTTIYVGRNRRGNEYLSFTIAKGQDIWMHARGTPGAHVVLKSIRGCTIPDECIQLGANLAAFYSDARTERKTSITAAEPKHILKPRGAPLGSVKLREELFVRMGYPDNVPENLKEARDASGLGIEYRATDKAKLRKRNQDSVKLQKQQQKKAKQQQQQQKSKQK